ncbi:MAG: nucleotidyl transferase AbiEii/AbiGii toxin family protein [Betaproteobacteria bacterium]|nr:nucleotidyl transferase AbiEii/AbiGii toxin family protein [Betaproteobacteria bacterium]
MTSGFFDIIAARPEDRRDLFLATATRLGTSLQNIEKDFWVTWALALLFNGREKGEPRLLFKGGTSLSKAYGLISRFSEDIDITVFRRDIGLDIDAADLEGLSGRQQRFRLGRIKRACQNYVQMILLERLNNQVEAVFRKAGLTVSEPLVFLDPDDPDGQTLLIRYASVYADENDYIRPTVKVEVGARSALDPHRPVLIRPYVADDMKAVDLDVPDITTIDVGQTFWDKTVILHGLRQWYDNRGALRQQGHRVSRHYYDLHMLWHAPAGQQAVTNRSLALDCARHALIFFDNADLDLAHAHPGAFKIVPSSGMADALRRDYQAMQGMIFGDIPEFDGVLESVQRLENAINHTDD